jgi:mannosyl-3-phosphoglycerate phosphatase
MMLIFSDIDGTLLDYETWSYRDALPGLELLKRRGIPLVLVSSKTFGEMEPLHRELGLDAPFAFENGAGIAVPSPGREGYTCEMYGRGIEALRAVLPLVGSVLGRTVVTIQEMTVGELSAYTGLPGENARLARERQASLPFILEPPHRLTREESAALDARLAGAGLSLSWGGKFYHFRERGVSKESAVKRVVEMYAGRAARRPVTVGIGDSENDYGMLDAVDRAFLVKNRLSDINYTGSRYAVTGGFGPAGFTEAVRLACGE